MEQAAICPLGKHLLQCLVWAAGEITVDNESNKNFTVMSLNISDYPGLLRVVAWVLNGLSLLVENARCVLPICPVYSRRTTLSSHHKIKFLVKNQSATLCAAAQAVRTCLSACVCVCVCVCGAGGWGLGPASSATLK